MKTPKAGPRPDPDAWRSNWSLIVEGAGSAVESSFLARDTGETVRDWHDARHVESKRMGVPVLWLALPSDPMPRLPHFEGRDEAWRDYWLANVEQRRNARIARAERRAREREAKTILAIAAVICATSFYVGFVAHDWALAAFYAAIGCIALYVALRW
jgi:hypothetical protein